MTTPPAPDGAIEYVADIGTAGRLCAALLRYRFTRPVTWVNLAVLGGLVIAFGFGVDQPWTGVMLIVLLLPAVTVSQYFTMVRHFRRPFGPGTRHWTLFRVDTLTIAGPLGVTETHYQTFQQVWRTADVLVLRIRGMRAVYLLPGELVPSPALGQLQGAVEHSC